LSTYHVVLSLENLWIANLDWSQPFDW
jgi:hypothetical protein